VHLPLNAAKWQKGTDYFSPPARQSKKLDEEVARLHLEKNRRGADQALQEMAEYLGVRVEGACKPEHYRY
jgi:adenosylhomocysteinase